MAHENNYPNGWKDGWSSADHATESYSPYAWERARREASSSRNNVEEKSYSQRWVEQHNKEVAQAKREQAARSPWEEMDREREQQRQEREKQREEHKRACSAANYRYKRLSTFEKLKLILLRKNPNNINMESMNVDEINNLYGGKSR